MISVILAKIILKIFYLVGNHAVIFTEINSPRFFFRSVMFVWRMVGILSSTGAGFWRKAPGALPDSSSVLDKFPSAINLRLELEEENLGHSIQKIFL